LKDAIAEAAARIDKELEFAREIQLSSLPTCFLHFQIETEFDIFAAIFTAKEVGG
jgi:serine phosphatase RsbU (regulator of sigma subunit)